ncbi:hypothetical protein LINPERPRIM_LOCUS4097 [Linum perenne]
MLLLHVHVFTYKPHPEYGEGSCSRYTSDGSWVLIAPIDSLRTYSYR